MRNEILNYLTDKFIPANKSELQIKPLRILEFICQNFTEYNMGVEFIAGRMDLSPERIHSLCNAHFRMSPASLICYVRMLVCLEYILKGETNFSIISVKCGFHNPKTFSRNFKKIFAVPPGQFLEKKKEAKNINAFIQKSQERLFAHFSFSYAD